MEVHQKTRERPAWCKCHLLRGHRQWSHANVFLSPFRHPMALASFAVQHEGMDLTPQGGRA